MQVKRFKKYRNHHVEYKYKCCILGEISCIYEFDSLCDFQFLPLSYNDGNYCDILPDIFPPEVLHPNKLYFDPSPKFPEMGSLLKLFLNPFPFSDASQPCSKIFIDNFSTQINVTQNNFQEKSEIKSIVPKKAVVNRSLYFEDKLPEKPVIIDLSLNQTLLLEIKNLFDSHPIWSRNNFMSLTHSNRHSFRDYVGCFAYNFVNGPWRRMWIKFGVDPRLDKTLRKYQTFVLMNLKHSSKKSSSDGESLVYEFPFNTLPPTGNVFLRYCDFKDSVIERMIDQEPYSNHCHITHGWFTPDFKFHVLKYLYRTYPQFFSSTHVLHNTVSDV